MADGYLGIDIGSISTKGVVIDESRNIIARSYLWTEGNPINASKRVVRELADQLDIVEVGPESNSIYSDVSARSFSSL